MTAAHLRTLVAVTGLGFTTAALGGACLDYAGEDWGACAPSGSTSSSSGVVIGSGSGSARLGAGTSASTGTGTPGPSAADCIPTAPDGG